MPNSIPPLTIQPQFPRTNIEEVLKNNREANFVMFSTNPEVDVESMIATSAKDRKSFYDGIAVDIYFPKYQTHLTGQLKEINQETEQVEIWLSGVSVVSFVDVQCIWGDHKESPVELTLNEEKMLRLLYPDSFQGEIKEKEETLDCRFVFRYLVSP